MRAIVVPLALAACHHATQDPMSSRGGTAPAEVAHGAIDETPRTCTEQGYAVTAVNHTSAHGDLCGLFGETRASLLPLPIVKGAAIRVELVEWKPVEGGRQLACGVRLSTIVGGKLLGTAQQTLTIQREGNPGFAHDCLLANIFDLMENKIVPLLKPLGPTPPPPPPITITVD